MNQTTKNNNKILIAKDFDYCHGMHIIAFVFSLSFIAIIMINIYESRKKAKKSWQIRIIKRPKKWRQTKQKFIYNQTNKQNQNQIVFEKNGMHFKINHF